MIMIERVARAIAAVEGYDIDGLKAYATTQAGAREEYERLMKKARAAIEALREPTQGMVSAADGLTDLVGAYPEANTPEARRSEFACAWSAMIDAALNEQVTG